MELEAEVAKLKEENQDLRKKQVLSVVGNTVEAKITKYEPISCAKFAFLL